MEVRLGHTENEILMRRASSRKRAKKEMRWLFCLVVAVFAGVESIKCNLL